MKTELRFTPAASAPSELLAVFAADTSASKDKDAKPEVTLLTSDEAVRKTANFVLGTGEFKAEANETLLLHAPEGLAATRLLIVGLGKAAKADPHAIRRAAGTAVRFAKPRAIRSLAILVPEGNFDPAQSTRAHRRRRHPRRLRLGHLPHRTQGPQHRIALHPRSSKRRQIPCRSRSSRRRHHCRVPELRPHPHQRARQPHDPHHPRPARCRDGRRKRPQVRSLQHRQAPRAQDGSLPQRRPGLRRTARAHRHPVRARIS